MLNRFLLLLRTIFRRERLEREMQEEMDMHLELASERLRSRGMTEQDAQHAARREFGNLALIQEEGRDARGARWIESIIADFRFGFRHFGRTPFSTMMMVVLLALGIGINSALFTVIYSFLRMPPPGIERSQSLVRIRGLDRNLGPTRTRGREFSYSEYREYAARTNLFSTVAAWTSTDVVLEATSLHSGAATFVTSNYFQVLGVQPAMGPGLPASSADDGAPQLVGVISDVLWDRAFGRAPDVIGKTINVNNVAVSIVGVAPKRFAGARTGGSQMRVWLPLNARAQVQQAGAAALASPDSMVFSLGARLLPGVTAEQTLPTVQAIAARAAQQSERWRTNSAISTDVVPLLGDNYYPPSGEQPNPASRAMSLLIPLLILLIPCTNVSGLLVGLAIKRRREIAVRLSLGAGRRRVVRQLVTESVLLALAAGIVGLVVILVMIRTIGTRLPTIQLVLHWPAIAFTFAVAVFTGVLFGISPALHATRVSVAEVLKNAANAVASTRSRLQSGLVVMQIALTLPLLLGLGALLLELFGDLQRMPRQAFGDRILQVSFYANPRDAGTDQQRAETLRRLQERIAAIPGVEAVVPQAGGDDWMPVTVHPADRVPGGDERVLALNVQAAAPGYFELMGFPFLRGRAFERTDDAHALVIRGDFARRLWGSADPIGRRLVRADGVESGAYVVVGVVDDRMAGTGGENAHSVFVPHTTGGGGLLVRTTLPAEPLMPTIRTVANAEAPLLPITGLTTLAAAEARQRATFTRASAAALGGGLIALFLSAIGLYAIVSFAVNERTREIGIRTALGADARQVVRMFFGKGLRLSVLGLIIGMSLSALVIRIATLAEGRAVGNGIFFVAALVTTVLVTVAALATWIPARRAARVDPLTMLRVE